MSMQLFYSGLFEPLTGKKVMILNGEYRDTEAILEGINEKSFCATLTLDSVSTHPI